MVFIEKMLGKKLRAPSWFNFDEMECKAKQHLASQCAAVHRVAAVIENEIATRGTSPKQIILSGFSQGGVVALLYAQLQASIPELGETTRRSTTPLRRLGGLVAYVFGGAILLCLFF